LSLNLFISLSYLPRYYTTHRTLSSYELLQNIKNTSATDLLVLRNLESKFISQLPSIFQGVYLCNILRAFQDKHLDFYPDSVSKIAYKVTDPNLALSATDIHHILLTLNQPTFYGRVSERFFEKFTDKILTIAPQSPVALLMAYMYKGGFYSERAFQICKKLWRDEIDGNFRRDVFREGFCALANTDFMDEETYLWCRGKILKHKNTFNPFDVVHISRSLVLMNRYEYQIFDEFIDLIRFKLYNLLTEKEKCILHQIFTSIQIDKPPYHQDFYTKLLPYKSEILAAYKKNRYQTNSITQDTLVKFIREQRYKYKEMELIHDFYEADILLLENNTIIELMGWNFHTSQYTKQLSKSTLLKLRHLKALGYKVLIVSSHKEIRIRIPQGLEMLRSQAEITAVHILDSEIKVEF